MFTIHLLSLHAYDIFVIYCLVDESYLVLIGFVLNAL